ncbi:MAG: GNAT family N-acetyltransferase [Caldilineae bacterium]|nr:MAG: GNAT family N-acetyltransferase [Caldilineae bacterium]
MRDQLATYRNLLTLADGTRVLLRPLLTSDREALVNLFATASEEDRRYLNDDVTNRELVASWAENLDYNRVFPLVAVVHDRLVGDATLHFRKGPYRHQGELRIFLAREMRRRGLGTRMLQALMDVARSAGLHQLIANIVTDQGPVIKAFTELGFKQACTLPDAFMLPDGSTRDVAVMVLPLVEHRGEF